MESSNYTLDQWLEDYHWHATRLQSRQGELNPQEEHDRLSTHFQTKYPGDWQDRHHRFFRAVSFAMLNLKALEARNVATVGPSGANVSALLVAALWVHFHNIEKDRIDEDPDPSLILGYAETLAEGLDKQIPGWDQR